MTYTKNTRWPDIGLHDALQHLQRYLVETYNLTFRPFLSAIKVRITHCPNQVIGGLVLLPLLLPAFDFFQFPYHGARC